MADLGRVVRPTSSGPGRALVAVYGVLALSATARAVFQVATKLSHAPVAYLLSLFAAVVYVVATFALATSRRRLAWTAVLTELAGVLVVGTVSLLARDDFPDSTVWSGYGQGYGYVPLLLPVLGVVWLVRTGRSDAR